MERTGMRGRLNQQWNGAGRSESRWRESGNALVIALLVLLLLTSAGVTYIAVTKSEKQISGNQLAGSTAFYTAEAGITEGLYRMSFEKDSINYIGPANPAPGWGRYIVLQNGNSSLDPNRANLVADGLDNNGNGFVDEAGEQYPEVLSKQATASALSYPYVRVEYKLQGGQLVRFGDPDNDPRTPPIENLTTGAPVLRITASGRQGSARKVIEAEAVKFPLISINSAIWAGGNLALNGNAFLIDGADHYATAPYDTVAGATTATGVLTAGPTSDVSMTSIQEDNVTGTGGDASVSQSTYTYDFNALWASLTSLADYSRTGNVVLTNANPDIGTLDSPKVMAIDGNLTVQGTWNGTGILMVNGNLTMGGGCTFTGIIICTGDVRLAGGGPADVARIVGSVIFQSSLVDASSDGGSSRVFYSTEAIQAVTGVKGYTLSWWREL
jgi:hypothetical protein